MLLAAEAVDNKTFVSSSNTHSLPLTGFTEESFLGHNKVEAATYIQDSNTYHNFTFYNII